MDPTWEAFICGVLWGIWLARHAWVLEVAGLAFAAAGALIWLWWEKLRGNRG